MHIIYCYFFASAVTIKTRRSFGSQSCKKEEGGAPHEQGRACPESGRFTFDHLPDRERIFLSFGNHEKNSIGARLSPFGQEQDFPWRLTSGKNQRPQNGIAHINLMKRPSLPW